MSGTTFNGSSILYSDINLFFGSVSIYNNSGLILTNYDAVSNKILHLLDTVLGTREFEPTFGSRLPELLFDPIDSITAWKLKNATIDAISKWITEVSMNFANSGFTAYPESYAYQGIIDYKLLTTNQNYTLTFGLTKPQINTS